MAAGELLTHTWAPPVMTGTAHRRFFAFWKDVDPDVPILRQAKAEYAKLQ
jgi:hypothetical protein